MVQSSVLLLQPLLSMPLLSLFVPLLPRSTVLLVIVRPSVPLLPGSPALLVPLPVLPLP